MFSTDLNTPLNESLKSLILENKINLIVADKDSSFLQYPNDKEVLDKKIRDLITSQSTGIHFYLLVYNSSVRTYYKFIISDRTNTVSIALIDFSFCFFDSDFKFKICIKENSLITKNISLHHDNKYLFNLPVLNDKKIKLKENLDKNTFSFKPNGSFMFDSVSYNENYICISLVNGAIKEVILDPLFNIKKITLSKNFLNKFDLHASSFHTNQLDDFFDKIDYELDIFKLIEDKTIYFMKKNELENILKYVKKILENKKFYDTSKIINKINNIINKKKSYLELSESENQYHKKYNFNLFEKIIIKSLSEESILHNDELLKEIDSLILDVETLNTI